MLGKSFRPWGQLNWVLDRLPDRSWSLLGCEGPEVRSLAVWNALKIAGLQAPSMLIKIEPPNSRFSALHAARMKERDVQLQQIGLPSEPTETTELFASDSEIVRLVSQFTAICNPHVIVDISSFPKRFFFPFIKRLLAAPQIETLLASYTLPESYPTESLAEDHVPLAHLPLFGPSSFPEKKIEAVVVAAGFMKLGLSELLDPYKQGVQIYTLLPFPPGLPAFHRNWEFIREIKKTVAELPTPTRVEAFDCSDAFDHIYELTNKGRMNSILAPYGPKPLSLAMCLFASVAGGVVYYTQPTAYNPDYSRGVRLWDKALACYAYCLKIGGVHIYDLPKHP